MQILLILSLSFLYACNAAYYLPGISPNNFDSGQNVIENIIYIK